MDDQFAQVFTDPRHKPKEMTEDEEYQRFVESMVQHCRCAGCRPCDGVLAGGVCDDIQDDEGPDDEICVHCNGTGQYDDATPCSYCDGTGENAF